MQNSQFSVPFQLSVVLALGFLLMQFALGQQDVAPEVQNAPEEEISSEDQDANGQQIGRYIIVPWPGGAKNDEGGPGAYVINTATGEVETIKPNQALKRFSPLRDQTTPEGDQPEPLGSGERLQDHVPRRRRYGDPADDRLPGAGLQEDPGRWRDPNRCGGPSPPRRRRPVRGDAGLHPERR